MADLTDDQKTIAAQTDQIKTLTDANADLTAQLEQASTVVTDLKQKLADKTDGTPKLDTLTIGKSLYEFVSDFFWKGEPVTLEALKENAELAAELVKEGISHLRPVTTKKGK